LKSLCCLSNGNLSKHLGRPRASLIGISFAPPSISENEHRNTKTQDKHESEKKLEKRIIEISHNTLMLHSQFFMSTPTHSINPHPVNSMCYSTCYLPGEIHAPIKNMRAFYESRLFLMNQLAG
jgi:hypothetical protein